MNRPDKKVAEYNDIGGLPGFTGEVKNELANCIINNAITHSYMLRSTILIFLVFACACNQAGNSQSKDEQANTKQVMVDTVNKEYRLTTRFNAFDTTVEVLFTRTYDSASETQKKNYAGFIAKQDLLTPAILQKVFDFYKSSYADYKAGWTISGGIRDEELEKNLPKPTTPENLKPFITPAIVHIQSSKDCEEGTLAIEFDCTWDIENGLGVLIKNWKVTTAGPAEIVYF